jgi:replication-associated recombination protein RarA
LITMVGQSDLRAHLLKLIVTGRFPRTVIIQGGARCGKKMLAEEIARLLNADIYRPLDLKVDSIRDIQNNSVALTNKRIYLLADAHTMTNQAQNALLKLAEEPSVLSHIIMTTDNPSQLLPTILSRSILLPLDAYTREELATFTQDETLLSICESPGQIKHYEAVGYRSLFEHCERVADNIASISAANVFNILKHVQADQLDLLIPMLIYVYGERLKWGRPVASQIKIIYNCKQLLARSNSVNVNNALEMMFVRMRGAAQHEV